MNQKNLQHLAFDKNSKDKLNHQKNNSFSPKISSQSLKSPFDNLTMTIKQQQAIQKILQETAKLNNPQSQTNNESFPYPIRISQNNYDFNEDIEKLLKQSQQEISEQYENMAREQLFNYRVGISIRDDDDKLQEIFSRMDAETQSDRQSFRKQAELMKKQISFQQKVGQSYHNAYNLDQNKLNYRSLQQIEIKAETWDVAMEDQSQISEQQIDKRNSQPVIMINEPKQFQDKTKIIPNALDVFEEVYITKPKQKSLQIQQLNQRYPKINITSMYRNQYSIFNFSESSANKYIRFLKKSMKSIQCAISFYVNQSLKWTILAIDSLLYIFVGDAWKEPIIVNPHRNNINPPPIVSLAVSKSSTHICVALYSQILLYEIKKESNSIVLVKNLSFNNDLETKLTKIKKIIIYNESPIKIAYLDNNQNIGLISCENMVVYVRVNQKMIKHDLNQVIDMDLFSIQNHESNSPTKNNNKLFSLNKKIANFVSKPMTVYCAFTSRTSFQVYRIQPNMEFIQSSLFYGQAKTQINIRWRYHSELQLKPQLFLSYNNHIYIYKLVDSEGNSSSTYLQLHLVYKNHYDIAQMEIISTTHLLLRSNQNIIVIAIPLIPSTDLTQYLQAQENQQSTKLVKKGSEISHDMFQNALVFVSNERECRILYACQQEIIFHSQSQQEVLRVAVLKTLQEHLDQQMQRFGHFREAFTLLILIHKQVNYSFKFSYTSESFTQCIFTAVQYTISSLILSTNDNIIFYRLSWICQLLLQTNNENMLWTTVHKKLLQKQKERMREWNQKSIKVEEQNSKKSGKARQSYFQYLLQQKFQSFGQKQKQANVSVFQQKKNKQTKSKIKHSYSMLQPEIQSAELLGTPPNNLEYILFDILEIFVLKSQIKSIPQPIFLSFVAYQCEKKCDTMVQRIIIENKQPYDGAKLLSILQSKERNYLQLYLFSRAIICDEPDFFTPFFKVFSSFKISSEEFQRSANRQRNEELKQKINFTGSMCLWYLYKCFKFEKIPSGMMTLNEKNLILSTLCIHILEPTFLRKLFEFKSQIFLQTFLMYFIGAELTIMIEQQNDNLVQKYKQFYPSIFQEIMSVPTVRLNNDETQDSEIFDKNFKQLVIYHLEKTIPSLKTQKFHWAEFKALAFYFNKSQISYSFETVIDILIVLFENKFQSYNLHTLPKIVKPSIENLQLSLIEYIKGKLVQKKDRFYIGKLLSFNDKNVSYQLYRIDQNYRLALDHFLNAKQPSKLIPFIYQLLGDIKELGKNSDNHNDRSLRERKFADIKQFLVKNIGTLFKINKFEALNIFYQIGETSQNIYRLIEENMGDKLTFLTAVLSKFENEEFQSKQKFQLEHLSEVCMLRNKQMLAYLDQFYYPLDSAIIVCQQKGNLMAKAIFEQRCGKIADAFISYERIIRNIIQSNKSKQEKTIRKQVRKYTKQCLRLCKQHAYDPNSNAQNNFWLRIITFINGFIKSNSQHKVFLKVQFERVLKYILQEMFKFLPITLLIDFFIAKGHRLQLSSTKQFSIYENLFVLARFDIEVAIRVLEICKVDVKDARKQTLSKRKKGMISAEYCDFCKKGLSQQNICNVYTCQHSFHNVCHDDTYRCLTCYFQSDSSIFKANIFGKQASMWGIEQKEEKQQKQKNLQKNKKIKNKKAKREEKQIRNVEIIVEDSKAVAAQTYRKKLKVFDFNEEKAAIQFYEIVNGYNKMEEQKIEKQKQEEFQNQYLRYSKQTGLVLKNHQAGQEIKKQSEQLNKK